jgi:hypothetical protein
VTKLINNYYNSGLVKPAIAWVILKSFSAKYFTGEDELFVWIYFFRLWPKQKQLQPLSVI